MQIKNAHITNAMTVDVEDYFHVSAFENIFTRSDWEQLECRVVDNTSKILDLFAKYQVQSTFFVLGWVAKKHPELVRQIISGGHELASHGFWHQRVSSLTPKAFREDIQDSKKLLEDIAGIAIKGYRAPSYSINHINAWAFDIIEESGFEYSSSVYPVKHDLYGWPDAPRFKFLSTPNGLIELPISTNRFMNRNYPSGGGGFFRLFPYTLSKNLIKKINNMDDQPVIFYFHPWEIDPYQPRVKQASARSKFRHYLNLTKMESRLTHLMRDFNWGSIANVFFR